MKAKYGAPSIAAGRLMGSSRFSRSVAVAVLAVLVVAVAVAVAEAS